MKNDLRQERIQAVQRFLKGEKAEAIFVSLGRSKSWLYKWVTVTPLRTLLGVTADSGGRTVAAINLVFAL